MALATAAVPAGLVEGLGSGSQRLVVIHAI
jgi:hypothetical protein